MSKAEMLKALEPFVNEVQLYIWHNGTRYFMDMMAYEIGEDGEGRLVVQMGPAIPNNETIRSVPFHGRGE